MGQTQALVIVAQTIFGRAAVMPFTASA